MCSSLLRATINFTFQTLQQLSIVVRNLLQVTKPKFQLPYRTFIILPEAYRDG